MNENTDPSLTPKRFPLGQLLLEKGIITQEQLEKALRRQKETGGMLGTVLLELGFVNEEAMFLPVLAGQLAVPYINLKETEIPPQAIQQIPAKFASHYQIMPVDFQNGQLTIATNNPMDLRVFDEISVVTRAQVVPALASNKDILETIRKYYGVGADTIERMMGNVQTAEAPSDNTTDLDDLGSDASISKFLNQILLEAYRDRASDIHIEPFEDELKIRYRVDGILYDAKVPANIKHFQDAIVSRIKILSNLNIAEKRVPQDGRFNVKVEDTDLDLRVSFLPTPYGESVVMRLLNATRLYTFEEMGMSEEERKILAGLINKPHGIIFLTGPTGSGKTSTLYSCLSRINTEDVKIITIEDPIEYQLKGITQVQINPPVGLTFAHGLRTMLRHDPDVMMVGEVRDIETAQIAIQVALTGHLIFSTLHTNDAASGVTRLLDMGVEPYLIVSSIECFIAQRLARLVCTKCRREMKVTREILDELEIKSTEDLGKTIYESVGCKECQMTGYGGREAIFEFLLMNTELRELVMRRASAEEIKKKAVERGMRTLRQAGWTKVLKGLTTPQEVLRVTKVEME